MNTISTLVTSPFRVTTRSRVPLVKRGVIWQVGSYWSASGVVTTTLQLRLRVVQVLVPFTVQLPAGSGVPNTIEPGVVAVNLATQSFSWVVCRPEAWVNTVTKWVMV